MQIKRMEDEETIRRDGELFENEIHQRIGLDAAFGGFEVTVSEIFFAPGERTTLHTHAHQQFLYITEGSGRVATGDEVFDVAPGDLVLIPGGEEHWHGASPSSTFQHLSILVHEDGVTSSTAIEEPSGIRTNE